MNLVFPTSEELLLIEQDKLPVLQMTDPIFGIMPIVERNVHTVAWEQKDNYFGLQKLRGLGGDPESVSFVGGKRYSYEPGVYGEFIPISETEMVAGRPLGSYGPINLTDLVTERQDMLLQRRIDRIRYIGWNTLRGYFSVSAENGLVHSERWPIQTYDALVPWGTSATATPLKNFRDVRLLEEGRSCSFGTGAKAYMNLVTANKLFANTNTNDIAGRRTSGLNSVLNLSEINNILLGEGLPTIVIHNDGYRAESSSGAWTKFILDDEVLVTGYRGTAPIIEYLMTRNASNPGMAAGPYTRVVTKGMGQNEPPPARVEVHDGHNGGPMFHYPGDVVLMRV